MDYEELISKNITPFIIASNRHIKLSILLPLQIASILCSLFIFLKILCQPGKLLKPISNHFIFVLLMTSFIQVTTELSMVENYLHIGIIRPSSNSYCLFFNWYEFSLNGISLFVMLWASIERHFIIFSHVIFQSQWRRFIFHYIPLIISIVYKPICYACLIFLYDCVNHWNYYELLCTAPCFIQNEILGSFDWLINIIIPAFSIAIANIILTIRVTFRSTRLIENRSRTKKNRKMTLQLLLIGSLFLVFWLPIAITGLIQQFISSTFLIDFQFNIFFYLIYFIQLFLPFVCLICLPNTKGIIRNKFQQWRRRNMVFNTTTLQMATVIRIGRD